ncbi:MAG: radical SAM protein [Candidatus Omnitrophota bacterium]
MKIALIEVKPKSHDYIAKEMAGGLGKRIRLGKNFLGFFLGRGLASFFSAPPIILAQLAGVARQCQQETKAYHTFSVDDIDRETDLAVVLSSMVDYRNEVNFIKALRGRFARLPVIVVGSFASAMPEIYRDVAHGVIKGEPEAAFEKILKGDVPAEGVIHIENSEDLNLLPMVDWEPFIRNGYYAKRPFSKELGVSIQKSRGCSMTCDYCPYAAFYGKTRHFDSEYVWKTIKYYYDRHHIRYFMFRDPNFGENRREFRAFMDTLLKGGLGISWSCEARLDTFQDEDLVLMRDAGLRYIIVGVESGDADLLKENSRRTGKREEVFRKVNILEKAGVTVQANYILGFPRESEQSVRETVAYAQQLNSMFATFHIFTPQPGTRIFEDYRSKFLDGDWEDFSYSNLVWRHDTLSKAFLEEITSKASRQYYVRPQWAMKHFGRLIRILSK